MKLFLSSAILLCFLVACNTGPEKKSVEKKSKTTVAKKTAVKTSSLEIEPKDKWINTPSGVKYRVIDKGSKDRVIKGDIIGIHYTLWVNDNSKAYEDTFRDKKPFTFEFGGSKIIEGLNIGLSGIGLGGKREIIIPADLGYGKEGFGDDIPGGATLHYIIKVNSIKPSPKNN